MPPPAKRESGHYLRSSPKIGEGDRREAVGEGYEKKRALDTPLSQATSACQLP